MEVTCLADQETSFEMRMLGRMASIAFVSAERLLNEQRSPLVLFGKWHEQGFRAGLQWLSGLAYKLPYPCILCAPFEPSDLGMSLGLQVGLEVQAFNSNQLVAVDADLAMLVGRRALRIQADNAFRGPAGKVLVESSEQGVPVAVVLQPKSTATPLVLCGIRLFSSSGLSSSADREALLGALVDWANVRARADRPPASGDTDQLELSPEKLRGICVLLAGVGSSTRDALLSLADAILGLDLSPRELDAGLSQLVTAGLVAPSGETVLNSTASLEAHIDAWGLRSYVRMLRADFGQRGAP